MNDPNITMEEYVQVETKRALRNGKVYNWKTATYDNIRYVDDINDLKFFEMEFPAIACNDALKSKLELLSKPTVSPQHVDEVNLDFEISFSEFDNEDYTFIYDNDSFSYKLISVNDLKSDMDNDVGIKRFLILFGITTLLIDVNAAQSKLVLLENFNENYSKCLLLLVEVKTA
ncbi:hypothetical protein Tco_0699635 [Tanacetum coccineum]